MLPARTALSNLYPDPTNAVARAGFAAFWDFINEVSQAAEIDVASSATVDVGGQLTNKLNLTGTTSISSFGTNYRGPIFIRFAGQLKLAYNATTLVTPFAQDIWTQAGDTCMIYPKSSVSGTANGWIVANYERGSPVVQVYSNITAVGNILTGVDNLMSYTIPANFFVNANRVVRVRAWGFIVNNVTGTLAWPGLSVAITTAPTENFTWSMEGLVVRSGVNQQTYYSRFETASSLGTAALNVSNLTGAIVSALEANPIALQFTASGTGTNDFVQHGMTVEYLNW